MQKQKRHIDEPEKIKQSIFRLDFLSLIFLLFVNTNSLIVTHLFVYPMGNVKQFCIFGYCCMTYTWMKFLLDAWYEMSLR